MDADFRQKMEENGADVETTINRFMGNEAMYLKFLGKILDDQNYKMLGENLEAKNYEEAFKCAHTLKGVTANLGLDPIQKAVSELVEEIRGKEAGEINEARVDEEWQNVKSYYEKFFEIISANR